MGPAQFTHRVQCYSYLRLLHWGGSPIFWTSYFLPLWASHLTSAWCFGDDRGQQIPESHGGCELGHAAETMLRQYSKDSLSMSNQRHLQGHIRSFAGNGEKNVPFHCIEPPSSLFWHLQKRKCPPPLIQRDSFEAIGGDVPHVGRRGLWRKQTMTAIP